MQEIHLLNLTTGDIFQVKFICPVLNCRKGDEEFAKI